MKDYRFAKFVLLINGVVPGAILLWDAMHGHAGANPVNYAILTTGLLALIFLTLSLMVTPLRKITGFSWLFHFRRTLGLYAFYYALAHFGIFFVFDRALNIADTFSEMVKRPYLIVGSIGLLAMVPLAVTSTNAMIRRLGSVRWRRLHRLAYLAAIAGVTHFYMQVKSDTRLPVTFGIVLAILLGYRLVMFVVVQLKKPAVGIVPVTDPMVAGRWTGKLRVGKIIQETWNVKTFHLLPPDGEVLPFAYLPGQYLTFTLNIDGKTIRRSYTIASTPSRKGHCQVTIKREEMGLVSRHMHDKVQEGDLLAVAAPSGKFTFTGVESGSVALLAAGVGITPLMSMLRNMCDGKWDGQIYLVYSNKTPMDIIFRAEIEQLQQVNPNLHVIMTLTRAEGTDWAGATGRVDAMLLERMIPEPHNIPYYLCGPASMLSATGDLLLKMGVPKANIHTESFGTTPAATDDGSEYAVTFARSNRMATAKGSQPILVVAESLGIDVDSECRSGICGRCRCKLVSGSVKMDVQEALSDEDRKNNVVLLCQARALEDVVVDA